jgi:GH24 family phage-related lysozyme (muramidase)
MNLKKVSLTVYFLVFISYCSFPLLAEAQDFSLIRSLLDKISEQLFEMSKDVSETGSSGNLSGVDSTDPGVPSRCLSGSHEDNYDFDKDCIPNGIDPDVDGDMIPNAADTDSDNDGVLDLVDRDDDNDCILDEMDPNFGIPGGSCKIGGTEYGDPGGEGIPAGSGGFFNKPFGGVTVYADPATCNCAYFKTDKITIDPVGNLPRVVLYSRIFSRPFEFYTLEETGAYQAGSYMTMAPCMVQGPIVCAVAGYYPLISIVGSSFPGPAAIDGGVSFSTSTGPIPEEPVNCSNQFALCENIAAKYTAANEGWRNDAYVDSIGLKTIGVGHQGTNVPSHLEDPAVRCTYIQDRAIALGGARWAAKANGVDFDSLSAPRQGVLVDMAFNMGGGGAGLSGFKKMFAAIKVGNWTLAGQEVSNSNYGGQVSGRSKRNAKIMSTSDLSLMISHASSDPDTNKLCGS